MSFIRGVLARARGEAGRIRPRRDVPAATLDDLPASEPPAPRPRSEAPVATVSLALTEGVAALPAATPQEAAPPADRQVDTLIGPGLFVRPSTAETGPTGQESTQVTPRQAATSAHEGHSAAHSTPQADLRHPIPAAATASTRAAATAAVQNRGSPPTPPTHAQTRVPAPRNNERSALAEAEPQTRIDIRIGKLEIAPATALHATQPAPRAQPRPTPMTLAEYLAARSVRR